MMTPRYSNAPFVYFETDEGGQIVEAEYFPDFEEEVDPDSVVFYNAEGDDREVWFAELHMPGYLDRTGWNGPFDSKQEARDHIIDVFEVDPDSGAPLDD